MSKIFGLNPKNIEPIKNKFGPKKTGQKKSGKVQILKLGFIFFFQNKLGSAYIILCCKMNL